MIKKNYNRKKIIIVFFVLLTIVVFLFQNNIKTLFHYISSPIQKKLWEFSQELYGVFEKKEEILKLRRENASLNYQLGNINFYIKENEELRNALNLELKKDFDLILSDVISKRISEDIVVINKGSENGIKVNMPVITSEKILIGKISKVYDYFSEVDLISKTDFSFDVLLGDEAFAVAKGKGNLNINIELIPNLENIEEEIIVLTNGMGGIFPEGLLVGKIVDIQKNDTEFYSTANLVPFFSINNIRKVFIIDIPTL